MSIRWHAKKFHLQKPLILYFIRVGNRNQGTFILFSSFFVAIFFYLLPSVVFAAFCTFSSSANDQQNRSKEKKFSRWLVACAMAVATNERTFSHSPRPPQTFSLEFATIAEWRGCGGTWVDASVRQHPTHTVLLCVRAIDEFHMW